MANDSERLVVLLEARIRDFEKNMAKASGTADRNFTKMRRDSRSATRAMEADIVRSSSRINAALAATSTRIGAFKTAAIAGLGTLGIGLGLGQIASSVRSVVAEAAGLVDTADKIGLTTTALQELRFAGKQAGVEIGTLDNALAFFSKTVGDASRGGGELHDILEANGIAIRDQAGNVRPLNDLFLDYADLVARAGSAQERNLLVTKAFGRSADEMGNMFQDGAKGVRAATDEVNRLGGVIDDAKLRRIAELDDRWDAFATTMGVKVKGAVLDVVTWLTDLDARIRKVDGSDNLENLKRQAEDLEETLARIRNAARRPELADELADEIKETEDALARVKAQIAAIQRLRGLAGSTSGSTVPPAPPPPKAELPSLDDETTKDIVDNGWAVTRIMEEIEAAEQRAAETADYLNSTLVDALDAVLIGGEDATEVIAGLAKQLASAALQAAALGKGPLADLFGTSSTGGFLGSLLQGGKLIDSGLMYDKGGYTGSGGRLQPAGIVHKGEYVFDQDAVRRIGVGNLEAIRSGAGYAAGGGVGISGGPPAALNVSVRVLDRTGEGVSVKEGEKRRTPGGGVELDLIVDRMVAAKMGTRGSASNKALRTMGVSGQLTRR